MDSDAREHLQTFGAWLTVTTSIPFHSGAKCQSCDCLCRCGCVNVWLAVEPSLRMVAELGWPWSPLGNGSSNCRSTSSSRYSMLATFSWRTLGRLYAEQRVCTHPKYTNPTKVAITQLGKRGQGRRRERRMPMFLSRTTLEMWACRGRGGRGRSQTGLVSGKRWRRTGGHRTSR